MTRCDLRALFESGRDVNDLAVRLTVPRFRQRLRSRLHDVWAVQPGALDRDPALQATVPAIFLHAIAVAIRRNALVSSRLPGDHRRCQIGKDSPAGTVRG